MSVGIDFGDNYSSVAVWRDERPHVIANEAGDRCTPSWVAHTTETLVGLGAKNLYVRTPQVCISNIKSLLGISADHADASTLKLKHGPEIVDVNGKVGFKVGSGDDEKVVTALEAATSLFANLKTTAETFHGEAVTKVVVNVPSDLSEAHRADIVKAASGAGLEVIGVIHTPAAAVFAHGIDQETAVGKPRTVVVVDCQARKVVTTVLKVQGGTLQTLGEAESKDVHGKAIDNKMVSYFANEFKKKFKADMTESARSVRKLGAECESLKVNLSNAAMGAVNCESLYEGMDFHTTINRGKFEATVGSVLRRLSDAIEDALEAAKLKPEDINDVVIVGGIARIPKIERIVDSFFDSDDVRILSTATAEEDIAKGACTQAAYLEAGNKGALTPETVSTTLSKATVKSTTASLSLALEDGSVHTLVAAGVPVPHASRVTLEGADGKIGVHLVAGEAATAADNTTVAQFVVDGKQAELHLVITEAGEATVTVTPQGGEPVAHVLKQ